MGTRVELKHRMEYRYDKAVSLGPQILRLHPAAHCRTEILNYSLNIWPSEHSLYWQVDVAGNHVARFLLAQKTEELAIEVSLVADLTPINPFNFLLERGYEEFPFHYSQESVRYLLPYRTAGAATQNIFEFLQGFDTSSRRSTIELLIEVTAAVNARVAYSKRFEAGVRSPGETLRRGEGSCRDSAHLLAELLRHLGFAARFVSGYLIQSQIGNETESSELHAWTEVFLPGPGWVGVDATSGLFATEGHIPLACAASPDEASPLFGTVEPSHCDLSYSIRTRALEHTLRAAAQIEDEQWQNVRALARHVDADLLKHDVRLTMGREPTYVGLDEPDSPQWNGAALGYLKWDRAMVLLRRLASKMAAGPLLHFGQGKWYPGEPLPRWALQCFWRIDGCDVWRDEALVADHTADCGQATGDALTFLRALARRLQVGDSNILPAYNDAETLAGYVLPLRRRLHDNCTYWSSQPWFPRPERINLLWGDSPVGYRIPVDSLPWIAPELGPENENDALPEPSSRMDLFDAPMLDDPLGPEAQSGASSRELIRPSLSVEVRQGRIHVFMPYMTRLSDYLDLVTATEDTAVYLKWKIWIEGYAPPRDPRLRSFSITPDPGVVEVNVQPAATWPELEMIHRTVDEEARACRLTAEKFYFDGKRGSTNGGNHIVIGGPTVADSPVLRRPDLLRSMLAFWQNHPSLSYLFAGTFIGPTSQYPRVDEARMDSLYELEIAFSQLPGTGCAPEIVGQIFRNLLVDVTGNTHRAEFCIDKLYPSQGLQLGLLELRAFEMTRDVESGLLTALLVRALISTFWRYPYEHNLVRWSTSLHDRFLLPHYLLEDFRDVLMLLRRFGYDFEFEWFQPHIDFRLPHIGSIQAGDVGLELRQALEPWHVLGEEATAGGTVRNADTSLDRIQVKISGFNEAHHAVTCNGRRVPLCATGTPGVAVAGVRYRTWLPDSTLHPTIPVHAPLRFEIVDTWNKQSMGSCSYHAAHPQGRYYDARPSDAEEAHKRRQERFIDEGRVDGHRSVPPQEQNPSFPTTLDLRWPALQDAHRVGTPALAASSVS